MANTAAAAPSSDGVGLSGALFLLFLGLKLGGVIAWSWWWVTAPLWIPAIVAIVIVLIILAVIFSRDF